MRRARATVLALLMATFALVASACSSSGNTTKTSDAAKTSSAFPTTMHHAFGATTIKTQPKRVVTLGWGVADAALAVGVVPAAMEYQAYGTDKDGVPSWVHAKLTAMHAATPTVLPKTTGDPAYEAIIKAKPDVIIAVASGITAKQYDTLRDIAPTVAYTGKPFTTSWRDVITQTAQALGRTAQAKAVLAGIDNQIAGEAKAHPELAGKTVAAVWDVGGTFYVYRKADARVNFMLGLGLRSAPSVDTLANGKESFYYTLSYEKVDKIASDIVVTYADTPALLSTFLAKSYAKTIPAVRAGAVATIVGTANVAAVSPPTALSLPKALPGLVAKLSAAAKKPN